MGDIHEKEYPLCDMEKSVIIQRIFVHVPDAIIRIVCQPYVKYSNKGQKISFYLKEGTETKEIVFAAGVSKVVSELKLSIPILAQNMYLVLF